MIAQSISRIDLTEAELNAVNKIAIGDLIEPEPAQPNMSSKKAGKMPATIDSDREDSNSAY
ncbi:hypothetical protein IWQ62_002885, partial [Dispira parvispora]